MRGMLPTGSSTQTRSRNRALGSTAAPRVARGIVRAPDAVSHGRVRPRERSSTRGSSSTRVTILGMEDLVDDPGHLDFGCATGTDAQGGAPSSHLTHVSGRIG